jgi:hypothetical protein
MRQRAYKGSFFTKFMALVLAFCIGAVGYLVVARMNRQAILLQEDTLQKLTYAGEINANQAEGYARTLLFLQADDSESRNLYRAEIASYSQMNDISLKNYETTLSKCEPESRNLFDGLVKRREQYAKVRNEVISLADRQRKEDAMKLAATALLTAYRDYTEAGDVLVAHGVAVGKQRAREIRRLCTITQFLTASLCIIVFLAGLFLSFLLSLVPVFEEERLRAAPEIHH